MGTTEKASTMAVYIQMSLIFLSTLLGLLIGDGRYEAIAPHTLSFLLKPWVMPNLNDGIIIFFLGIFSAFGGFFISQGYRLSEPSKAAPFEYISLILSLMWGIFLFNEFPDFLAYFGISLIALGGIYIYIREGYRASPKILEKPL